MRALRFLVLALISLVPFVGQAQIESDMDETKLYAESKQVNQFFRRFNGEEDEKGKRFYSGDKQYRNVKLRKKYLSILFDDSNQGNAALKAEFAKSVLDHSPTAVLDFHSKDWFAEVNAVFTSNGKDQPVTLFMELEKDHLGTKWVIQTIHADMYDTYFLRDTTRVGRFLHPMSHELDFMNLRKAFSNLDSISQFTVKRFQPDHLSLLLYEIKKGNLKFKSVETVKFHFFQIEGWYFEISDFNRSGYNTGWLISNVVKINSGSDKDLLRKYLYHEKR